MREAAEEEPRRRNLSRMESRGFGVVACRMARDMIEEGLKERNIR